MATIRPARPGDAPALHAIVERAYAPYVPRIGRRPAPMDDDYGAAIADPAVDVFVSTRPDPDGTITGLLVLVPHDDHLLVENVAVDPAHHGTGLGRALLAHAELQAAERGLPELRLYTNAAMTENLALYPRLGWTETGRREEAGFQRVYFRKPAPAATADPA